MSSASIRHSVAAMQAVAGMSNPLQEASLVRTGTRLAFRCDGAMVDPIRRQLLFDFERVERQTAASEVCALPPGRQRRVVSGIQELFVAAVQAEETGEKTARFRSYEEMLRVDPDYAPGYINLGTIHFHLRQFVRAEELYRRRRRKIRDTCWLSLISAMCWMNWSGRTNPLPLISERWSLLRAMPTPTTTWPWPSSAKANAGRRCGTGKPM